MGKKSRKGTSRAKTQRPASGQGAIRRKGSSVSDSISRTSGLSIGQTLEATNPPHSVVLTPDSIASGSSIGFSDTASKILLVPEKAQELLQVPVKEETPVEKKVLVLVSKQSIQRDVTAKQQTSLLVLHSNGIPFTMVDGSNPGNKERRNNLFDISGKPAIYPQFFILEGENTTFWGDFEAFEAANDNGNLAKEMMGTASSSDVVPDVWGTKLSEAAVVETKEAVLDVTTEEPETTPEIEPPVVEEEPTEQPKLVVEATKEVLPQEEAISTSRGLDLNAPAPEEAKIKQKDCECVIL